MISTDALFVSDAHLTAKHDLDLVQRLDRDSGVRTSVSLKLLTFWWSDRLPVEPPPQMPAPSMSTWTGTTLPVTTRERLLELTRLEPDWDSYGALAVSARAVAAAGTLISRVLARTGVRGVPHEIMPIADGGISLEWRYPMIELGINACPDGGWSYLLIERNEEGRHATEGYELSDDAAVALVFQAVGSKLF